MRKFFTHVKFLHFDYLCLNKILWPIASCSSQTAFCQMKHYAQLSGIIINTYPEAELLLVMSNLTLNALKVKANIVKYSKETNCMYPKLLIIIWFGDTVTLWVFRKQNNKKFCSSSRQETCFTSAAAEYQQLVVPSWHKEQKLGYIPCQQALACFGDH